MERWRKKIAREYGQLVKAGKGYSVKLDQSTVKAKVKTVVPMDEETKERLRSSLTELVGKDVELVNVIDPSILGGMVIHMGDAIVDMSLSTRLNDLDRRIHQELSRRFEDVPVEVGSKAEGLLGSAI